MSNASRFAPWTAGQGDARSCDQGLTSIRHRQGDLDSKDSLREAFKDAYAAYAVTNYWESMSADKEVQQGKNVVDAAKVTMKTPPRDSAGRERNEADVPHRRVVFSISSSAP